MLPILLALPFIGSLFFLILPRRRLSATTPWLINLITTFGCLVILGYATFFPSDDGPRTFFAEWIPTIGLNFSLWLDGPALFFSWVVLGIGFLIFFYSGFYLDPKDSPWRFYGTMLLFMGSMLGLVISRNALLMFVFWEMTSITSFILIGHWHEKDSAREGARRALIVTALGGLCLMAGIAGWFWLLRSAGIDAAHALDWDVIWANRDVLTGSRAGLSFMVLVLLGAFTKSAQFPFHFWLPGAMEAPTPVSAFLHAATMVKAGIYLLGRIYPIYWESPYWLLIVGSIGTITMLVGGFMALLSRDLKQLLAHSTVSQLGLLTAYYGFGAGLVDADKRLPLDLLLVGSHALFKGALFMLIGVVDHGTHTRDWTRLGGLRRQMPVTTILTIIGCASMAGVPLTFGFVAKELFLKMSLHLHTEMTLLKYGLPALAIFASLFTVAYCIRLGFSPFFGKLRDESLHPHEGGWGLLLSPAIMIGICLAAGFWVPILESPIASMVREEFYGLKSGFQVAMFHHIDMLLGIAAFLFAGGFLVYLAGTRIEKIYNSLRRPSPFSDSYHWIFDKIVPSIGGWLARTMQSPSLSRNATITLGFTFALVFGAAVYERWMPVVQFDYTPIMLTGAALIGLIAVCLVVVLSHPVFLVRLIAVSPIGLFVALFFLFFKAPDLALTQILVEVVLLIVLLLLLFHLPQRTRNLRQGGKGTLVRGLVAVSGGVVAALLVYTGMTSPLRGQPTFTEREHYPSVSSFIIENTKYPAYKGDPEGALAAGYPGGENIRSGGGNNAVNVILVDFRGLDTMGEIIVLALAALGVLTLLIMGREPARPDDPKRKAALEAIENVNFQSQVEKPGAAVLKEKTWPGGSLILREISRLVPSVILLFAVVLFFAGHNAPGGGFIAGLMASVGLVVLLIAFRRPRVRPLYKFDYGILIPIGLAFAVGTGLVAVGIGLPFLTSGFTYIQIPGLGEVELASALFLDLGVFLVVVGVTMMIVERLGEE